MFFNRIFAVLLLIAVSTCYAETDLISKSDLPTAPINISADSVEHDEKAGTITYEGNIEITQEESLKINADTLVISDAGDGQYNVEAVGSPVTFSHAPPDGETVNGHATNADFNAAEKILILSGNASVIQKGSTINSDRIVVDLEKSIATAGNTANGNQRVHTVIQPGKSSK